MDGSAGSSGPDAAEDLTEALDVVRGVVGQVVREVGVGIGSTVSLGWGQPLPSGPSPWWLWVQQCAWRIESDEEVLVGSEDDRLDDEVQLLAGRTLTDLLVDPLTLDLVLVFDGGARLRTFTASTERDLTLWACYLPGGDVFAAEAGSRWALEPGDAQRSWGWVRPERADGTSPRVPVPETRPDPTAGPTVGRLVGRTVVQGAVLDGRLRLDLGDGALETSGVAWRILQDGRVTAGSYDAATAVGPLDGRVVRSLAVSEVSRDVELELDGGVVLRTFSQVADRDADLWSISGAGGRDVVARLTGLRPRRPSPSPGARA